MSDRNLYIIAGPNGAGKTTASYTILPEMFEIKEFVNADEIAKGISPFNPEQVAFTAGRVMLNRIDELLNANTSFAFETTLASRSYKGLVKKAQKKGYKVILLFLTLNSVELAVNRVKVRVSEGGHNIPKDVIIRRYKNGISNFFNIYKSIVDEWILVDNSSDFLIPIAKQYSGELYIDNQLRWNKLMLEEHGK